MDIGKLHENEICKNQAMFLCLGWLRCPLPWLGATGHLAAVVRLFPWPMMSWESDLERVQIQHCCLKAAVLWHFYWEHYVAAGVCDDG